MGSEMPEKVRSESRLSQTTLYFIKWWYNKKSHFELHAVFVCCLHTVSPALPEKKNHWSNWEMQDFWNVNALHTRLVLGVDFDDNRKELEKHILEGVCISVSDTGYWNLFLT